MVNQIITYAEEMVGSGHPTKSDTLNRALLIEHGNDGKHSAAAFSAALATLQGLVIRSKFEFKDTDEIYLNPAVYHHNGTTDQILYWDAKLTYAFTNLAASDWSYLYLDDSAIVTAGTNVITATELVDSVTEPTWSAAKHGWYNGEDRCIFAVLTNGSSEILEFWSDQLGIYFASQIVDLSDYDIDNTWGDVSLTAPLLGADLGVRVTLRSKYGTANGGFLYWRKNGSSGDGHVAVRTIAVSTEGNNSLSVLVDATNKIELKMESSSDSTASVYTNGYDFPVGM